MKGLFEKILHCRQLNAKKGKRRGPQASKKIDIIVM